MEAPGVRRCLIFCRGPGCAIHLWGGGGLQAWGGLPDSLGGWAVSFPPQVWGGGAGYAL